MVLPVIVRIVAGGIEVIEATEVIEAEAGDLLRNLMFEAIDIDGDGTITAKELKRAIVGLKKLDTDGDGNLTLDEAVTPARASGPGGDPNQIRRPHHGK